MDIFSFSQYYYKAYAWDFSKEVISDLHVDAGRYYARIDLYYSAKVPIPYRLELSYNGERAIIDGEVFNYREYRSYYPSVMKMDSSLIRSTGFCRVNVHYIGPESVLKIYYPG